MTKLTSDFGAQVKAMRERLQLIQEALAESLGVSFATLSRWENGWTVPSNLAYAKSTCFAKSTTSIH
jgi:DNA-binding transcriptional regulator YiaG